VNTSERNKFALKKKLNIFSIVFKKIETQPGPVRTVGALEPSVVFQVNRNAGCPPGVTSDGGEKTRSLGLGA
jgi:hypothetical protein